MKEISRGLESPLKSVATGEGITDFVGVLRVRILERKGSIHNTSMWFKVC